MAKAGYVPVLGTVIKKERLSPAFLRIVFGGEQLNKLGTLGPLYDQRLKLVIPGSLALPNPSLSTDWFGEWQHLDPKHRGVMRTYSIRDLHKTSKSTELTIDFVLHGLDNQTDATGPASHWAANAKVGDSLIIIGPEQGKQAGGVEFSPGSAQTILLGADETAIPAVARIIEDLKTLNPVTHSPFPSREQTDENRKEKFSSPHVIAFLETPSTQDILPLKHSSNTFIHWLPRKYQSHGELLENAIIDYLLSLATKTESAIEYDFAHKGYNYSRSRNTEYGSQIPDKQIHFTKDYDGSIHKSRSAIHNPGPTQNTDSSELLWETSSYSSLGLDITMNSCQNPSSPDLPDYLWLAGESGTITSLRRALVSEFNFSRKQVSFMGYWKLGMAMRG